jgi:hypothetical protein
MSLAGIHSLIPLNKKPGRCLHSAPTGSTISAGHPAFPWGYSFPTRAMVQHRMGRLFQISNITFQIPFYFVTGAARI